jgi:hypothetical protein
VHPTRHRIGGLAADLTLARVRRRSVLRSGALLFCPTLTHDLVDAGVAKEFHRIAVATDVGVRHGTAFGARSDFWWAREAVDRNVVAHGYFLSFDVLAAVARHCSTSGTLRVLMLQIISRPPL